VPNPQLKASIWWDILGQGDLPIDASRLEDEFCADETIELKAKKRKK
jgi:hypothetical protein